FGFTKELTGQLVLNTANTYGGVTTVEQGSLVVSNLRALGPNTNSLAAAGTHVLDGAQLVVPGNLTIVGEALELTGTGTFATRSLLITGAGVSAWRGQVTLVGTAAAPQGSIGVNAATANFTVDDPDGVSSVNGGGLVKTGAGRLIFPRDNTYTGLTTV